VIGWEADANLLRDCGIEAHRLGSGCCGLAGNFGFERGHRTVSEACAERVLLPAIRTAGAGTAVIADGFSCRTQIHQLDSNGREALHTAELLAAALET
jgi:Fe-S oxidoreductase